MRRVLSIAGVLLVSIVLQSTFFPRINLFGVTPDLILLVTVCYGLLYGPLQGLYLGLAGGFLLDLAGGGILGINILTKTLLGYGSGYIGKTVFKDNILIPLVVAVVATLAGEITAFLFLTAFGWQGRFFNYLYATVLPLSLYHLLLAAPVYLIFLRHLNPQGKGRI
ncbi:MAG: rod shape-determining protein MreD [Firmicutes bacterium]|nr:rod shape-determining protein MreD [Bacillota bacterium]